MAVLLIAIARLFISVGLNRGTCLRTVSFLFTHLQEKWAGYGRTPFTGADHAASNETQLGNDLVLGPALGVQVGCTPNIYRATVTNLFFGLGGNSPMMRSFRMGIWPRASGTCAS
jgi:hypothetical protein